MLGFHNRIAGRRARFGILTAAMLACGLAAACDVRYPATRTEVPDERPQLIVANAGEGAVLLVNGVDVGSAAHYAGNPGTLRLPSGTHVVEVMQGGQIVLRETVFLTDGVIRTVRVPSR